MEPLRDQVENSTGIRFESYANNDVGYSLNSSYPTNVTIENVLAISFFDDYSFLENTGGLNFGSNMEFQSITGFTPVTYETGVKGLSTGTKKILVIIVIGNIV
ncbi:hypothetical protein MM239_14905 [Belliella sp. DSM 111904]|uniref:Uncharacterized protein n=1 Tax=Belliella filtrata TaxID=2923435 RepID=A0ABS9V3Y2_9BACT|nr:hypothetical protein [Belliella filtrata]MCH7410695.1 hypothetical protein [Belliella filtrata]